MKVEIKVLPEAKEPYAVIYASEITPEIRRAVAPVSYTHLTLPTM